MQHGFIDVAVQQSLSNPLVPQFWAQCAAFLLRLSPCKRAMPAQARSCASTIAEIGGAIGRQSGRLIKCGWRFESSRANHPPLQCV